MPDPVVEDNRQPVPDPSVSGDGGATVFFWPILIFIIGTCISTAYQIVVMQDQLHSLKQAEAEQESRVRQALYEKDTLYRLAGEIMALSASDPIARQIVTESGIQNASPADLPQDDGAAR